MQDSNELITSVRVETRFDANTIEQEFTGLGMVQNLAKQVINLQEKAVEEALISLGWTPPLNEVASPHNKLEQGFLHHSDRMKAIAFSTGNITERDASTLDAVCSCEFINPPFQVMKYPEGYILRVWREVNWAEVEKCFSDELTQILQLCVNHGIYVVEIDRDAGLLDGAPVFDW